MYCVVSLVLIATFSNCSDILFIIVTITDLKGVGSLENNNNLPSKIQTWVDV